MMKRGLRLRTILAAGFLSGALLTSGCGVVFFTAAGAGGGWETYQNDQMQSHEQQYAAGKISEEEFETRKRRIQEASLLQGR